MATPFSSHPITDPKCIRDFDSILVIRIHSKMLKLDYDYLFHNVAEVVSFTVEKNLF